MDIRSSTRQSTVLMHTHSVWFPLDVAKNGSQVGLSSPTKPLLGLRRRSEWLKLVCGSKNRREEAPFNFSVGCACSLLALAAVAEASPAKMIKTTRTSVKRRENSATETTSSCEGGTSVPAGPRSTSVPLFNPSNSIVAYFEQLGLTGLTLHKCLKHAFEISEEDFWKLIVTFRSYGLQRGEFRAMLSKCPSLVKIQRCQVEQAFRGFSSLGFCSRLVIPLFVKRPALMTCDLEGAAQIIEFLVSLRIPKKELWAALSRRPHILEQNVDLLKNTLSALSEAGISQLDIRRLFKRVPEIFTSSVLENVQDSLDFWLSVGVEGRDLSRALLRRPNLLSYDISSMRITYEYLQRWLQPDDLTRVLRRFGEVLALDPEGKLEPLIEYFLILGVKEQDIGKIILRRPQLMACAIPSLEITVDYLKSLGVKEVMLGKIFTLSPQVFTLNAKEKLKRGVEYFRSMGLDKERDIELIFVRHAQVFCCSIDKNLQPKFEFFLSTGLSRESIAKMIVLFPSMLGQNIECSLAPKYNYLIIDMKRTVQELIDFPQYFGYSLEKRIKPRHKQLLECGIHKSLPSMLACTDIEFQKRYQVPHKALSQTSLKNENQVESMLV